MKFSFGSLFGSKKSRSRSDSSNFSNGSGTSFDALVHLNETPKSVLPSKTRRDVMSDWSRVSTDHQKWDVVEVFKLLDKDGDGKISLYELELVFHQLRVEPPSEEEVAMMLAEADLDGDGCISLEEFGAFSSALGPARGPELRDAFDYFDTDGDGRISAEELLGVFITVGDDGCTLEECRCMVDGVDKEGKGFVCFEDFARMMEGHEVM